MSSLKSITLAECGTTSHHDTVVQPFIILGRPGTIEEWPWQGQVVVDGVPYCGASLISNKWALTAAHCLE